MSAPLYIVYFGEYDGQWLVWEGETDIDYAYNAVDSFYDVHRFDNYEKAVLFAHKLSGSMPVCQYVFEVSMDERAAYAYVNNKAICSDDKGHIMWYGDALREAFLAGIKYCRGVDK